MQPPDSSAPPPKPSFAARKAAMDRPSGSTSSGSQPPIEGGYGHMRAIARPPPGDLVSRPRRVPGDLAKQRSSYFEDAFSGKDTDVAAARERIRCESMVLAEVRTNVIVADEFSFVTELSYHLSMRYQRPVSSVVVSLQHGACMLFRGGFDPAYVLTLSALPSQVQPTTNKRNAALVSKHMEEALGVPPPRGLIRFAALREEDVASGGRTLAAELEAASPAGAGEEGAEGARPAGGPRRRAATTARKRLSVRSLASMRTPPAPELTPPASASGGPSWPTAMETLGEEELPNPGAAKRGRGFVATLLGRRPRSATP